MCTNHLVPTPSISLPGSPIHHGSPNSSPATNSSRVTKYIPGHQIHPRRPIHPGSPNSSPATNSSRVTKFIPGDQFIPGHQIHPRRPGPVQRPIPCPLSRSPASTRHELLTLVHLAPGCQRSTTIWPPWITWEKAVMGSAKAARSSSGLTRDTTTSP